jgi:hypothetical protein
VFCCVSVVQSCVLRCVALCCAVLRCVVLRGVVLSCLDMSSLVVLCSLYLALSWHPNPLVLFELLPSPEMPLGHSNISYLTYPRERERGLDLGLRVKG